MERYIIITIVAVIVLLGLILPRLGKREKTKSKKHEDDLYVEVQPIRASIEFAGTIQNVENNTPQAAEDLSSVQEIDSIVIQDELGQQLSFNKVQSISANASFREVTYTASDKAFKVIQMAMPAGQQLYTATALAQMAPNGLFTATVNPSHLSHFLKDGTYTTMIHGKAGVATHAGFQKVPGLSGFNSVAIATIAFQAMAIISGNHYMHLINQKLGTIEKNIQEIMAYNTDKDIGTLSYAQRRLMEITAHQTVTDGDMEDIRAIKRDVGKLYDQYRIMYSQQLESLKEYHAAKEPAEKRMNKYQTEVNKFSTTAKICAWAYQICLQAAIAEICVSMKRDVQKAEIQNMISDAVSICRSRFEEPDVSYNWIERKAYRILEEKTIKENIINIKEEKKLKLLAPARDTSIDLKKTIRQVVETESSERIINSLQGDRQMLLIPGEDGSQPRIFIPMTA